MFCELKTFPHYNETVLYDPQSRAKCSEARLPSAICPGEKTKMEIGRPTQIMMQPFGSMPTMEQRTEGWTERFQDLQPFFPTHQDELNTPQFTQQDEFNFSIDVNQVKDSDNPTIVDFESEIWGKDFLLGTTCLSIGEEDNNNNTAPELKIPYNNINENKIFTADSQANVTSFKILNGSLVPQTVETKQQITDVKLCKAPEYINMSYTMPVGTLDQMYIDSDIKSFKTPQFGSLYEVKKERPKLKLNIDVATTSTGSNNCSLSTPEVLKPLVDTTNEFDLVRYVDSEDYLLGSNENTVAKDHDYTEPVWTKPGGLSQLVIKAEPLSPQAEELITSVVTTESGRIVKKRRREDSSSDFVFDSEADLSDDSADWEPRKKKSRSKKKQKLQKKVASELDVTVNDKYRELRDRNNEASRRSRFNRKQRDVEMSAAAEKLQRENLALKTKAERMEKLVNELRKIILKTFTNKNSQNTNSS